jgi:tRNA-dihydrouridine synthase A
LQLGGSDPLQLATAARMARDHGYQELNLNVGCPSDRVQEGRFGACLMAEPSLVAHCVTAMADATGLPITVKCRIGIDDQDTQRDLDAFVATVAAAGCRTFIIHARKAWLQGLSPKENREIPPLDYERVHALKQSFPALTIVLNGGLTSVDTAMAAIAAHNGPALDGVMLGRAVYDAPYLLADVDRRVFGDAAPAPIRADIVAAYLDYADAEIARGGRRTQLLRHLVGLFRGCPGARGWRQAVTRAMQSDAPLLELNLLAQHLSVPETLAA